MRTFFLCLIPALALAQGTPPGLTVTGEGSMSREPAFARVSFRISGEAEEAKDAITKCREKLEKMLAALKEGGTAEGDITVDPPSMATGQGDAQAAMQAMMRGRGVEEASPMVTVAIPIDVRVPWTAGGEPLAELEKIAAVLDKITEAGADNEVANAREVYAMYGVSMEGLGPASPQVAFHVDDDAALRAEAYGKAVEDARARAEALATKLGRKLGGVLRASVSEGLSADASGNDPAAYMRLMYGLQRGDASGAGAPTPIVRRAVQVEVEFALEP